MDDDPARKRVRVGIEAQLELNAAQMRVMELFMSGENVFVTGPGGSGKSHVLHAVVNSPTAKGKKVQVCATSGRAAVLLNCRARTVHSWAGIGLCKGPVKGVVEKALRKLRWSSFASTKQKQYQAGTINWMNVDVLILDEVSMLSRRVIEVLDTLARRARHEPRRPFGGIQVLFFGDFFQLPPTSDGGGGGGDNDDESMQTDRQYAFESPVWAELFPRPELQHVKLTQIYRQKDDATYIKILNEVREGRITRSSHQLLQSRVKNVGEDVVGESTTTTIPKLFPLRRSADEMNKRMYAQLSAEDQEHEYLWHEYDDLTTYLDDNTPIEREKIAWTMQTAVTSPEILQREKDALLRNSPCVALLTLKRGAQVMLCYNLDVEAGLCNGAMGVVVGFDTLTGKLPVVRFVVSGLTRVVARQTFQSATIPTIGFSQIPLKLAWGMTIHSSQGATLDSAEIDVGGDVFAVGQTYVALSRVKSLAGLHLVGYDLTRIKVSKKVLAFYKTF